MGQDISLKSKRKNPWFKPLFNILLHTYSNVCATVEGQCLEYLVYITLPQAWPLAVDFFELWLFFRLSTCGTTVTQNLTYIQNPSYPTGYTTTGNCIFTVTPLSTGRYRTIHRNYQVRPPVWVMFVCLFKQPIIIGSSQHPRNKFWVLCIDEL